MAPLNGSRKRQTKRLKSEPPAPLSGPQIKEARKAAVAAMTLEEKLAGQKQIKAIEVERGKRRRALFDAQDEIDRRREQLIAEVEGKLQQKVSSESLFSVRWQVR